MSAGNAFYTVYVQDAAGGGVGLYTATTGPSHPAGSGLNVLYGNGNPATSFDTIRSYTTGTDYIQSSGKSSRFTTVFLDPYGVVTALGSTGLRTTYTLPGPPTTPDAMKIVQDVVVNGTTFEDSTIDVTTTIENTSPSNSLSAGVRYFWDYQIGQDDGPVFQQVNSLLPPFRACSELTTETEFDAPTFEAYRIVDNDVNPHPPTFNIFGTVVGPDTVTPAPTAPDVLQYVCWPSAFDTAFEYTVQPGRDIATTASDCQSGTGGGDTAVDYFFGHDTTTALAIPTRGSSTVSASLFLTPITVGGTCVTRTSRFWFTHPLGGDTNCATLLNAIEASCGTLDLGFVTLPNGFNDTNNVLDAEDALIEALGFYYRSSNLTGEIGGTQSSKSKGSSLCAKRKKLAIELIAAIANSQFLGAEPSACSYVNAKTNVFFSSDLLDQARVAEEGADVSAIISMTALLRKFNLNGQAGDFPSGTVECSATKTGYIRKLARDPTTQANCPGLNNSCQSAEQLVFPSSTGSFSGAVFTRTLSINNFTNSFPSPTCGGGGRDAVWVILPNVGTSNRQFTVSTDGSNFSTMISIWAGTCSVGSNSTSGVSNGLNQVTCAVNPVGLQGAQLSFTTDGRNNFYIVGEGVSGQYGKLKLKITSP